MVKTFIFKTFSSLIPSWYPPLPPCWEPGLYLPGPLNPNPRLPLLGYLPFGPQCWGPRVRAPSNAS